MISTPDRQKAVKLIEEATQSGARLFMACAELEISIRTFQRWKDPDGTARPDQRPTAPRPRPANALTEAEQDQIVALCNSPEFASLPPGQIVPKLADRGEYIASESTMYRVLRQRGQAHRRGRAKRPRASRTPVTHKATGPCQVWSWDITWLPGPVLGTFYYLYLILDIYSRKIVGWEVHEQESGELAAQVVTKAVWAEGCLTSPLALHSDNGSPMKAATLRVTLEKLGVTSTFSRPRVSNDNPFSEAIFRTCKYVPNWPEGGFESLQAARNWVLAFVQWYNTEHQHSAIRFVTPDERHRGKDLEILNKRHALYQAAKNRFPQRWARKTRCWDPIREVWLNPEKQEPRHKGHGAADARPHNAGGGGPMAAEPMKKAA